MTEQSERFHEWAADHGDLEAVELVRLIIATGEWLKLLVPKEADYIWKKLFDRVLGIEEMMGTEQEQYADASLQTIWEKFGIPNAEAVLGRPPFEDLNGFAFYGLPPLWVESTQDTVETAIKDQIEWCRRILDEKPPHFPETPDMEQTVLAAEARYSLDMGQDVKPEQLAALARFNVRSIRNLMSGGSLAVKEGKIVHGDAVRWLSARPDFKSSIWQNGDQMTAPPEPPSKSYIEDVVFVPVARDGSWFDPVTCQRNGQYTVGAKGVEEQICDYRTAVDLLSRMPTPHWRRPNANGNWGIVTGVSWQRKVAGELDLSID